MHQCCSLLCTMSVVLSSSPSRCHHLHYHCSQIDVDSIAWDRRLMVAMHMAASLPQHVSGFATVCKHTQASVKSHLATDITLCLASFACRLIKESVSHWGTVDVLVNNAGITRDTLIMRMKPEQWQSVIDTNLSAVFYASQVTSLSPPPGSVTRVILLIPWKNPLTTLAALGFYLCWQSDVYWNQASMASA